MKKRYIIVLAGMILGFVMLTGCGMDLGISQPQQDNGSADSGQTSDSGQASNEGAAGDAGNGAQYSSGSTSGVAVSLEEAQNIALERVPGATSKNISIELDRDDGWYIYEGDIVYNGMEYEFEIDAYTGSILKWEEERW